MSKEVKNKYRSGQRELAFRSIFQISFHESFEEAEAGIQSFLEDEAIEKNEDSLDVAQGDFADALIRSVIEQQESIDDLIMHYIKDSWSMERIPNVEKAVLRLSIAEMLYLGTPKEIAINEAVNLVKKYADEDAYKYVNGILNHFAEDHL